MASVSHNKQTGRRVIQFQAPDGKRHTLRLGKVTKKQAEHVRLRVEQLLGAKITDSPLDPDTTRWVGSLDASLQKRLGAVGLITIAAAIGLEEFINNYINSRGDVKASTKVMYDQTRRRLLGYFDALTPIRRIDQPQAIAWRQHLAQTGLADNTVRRTTGIAKQFFAAAIRDGYVDSNPFQGLPCTVRPNSKRSYFITTEEAKKVTSACPDDEWRLIFTLCRYGGLRCPSELLLLTWDDIDWQNQRFTVHSPKTEHHDGHDMRIVPLFPEVAQALRHVHKHGRPDSKHLITRYRLSNVNLRTQLNRIIRKAGMEPWPKLFQNLRSSCETELAERFPLHVVTAWLGNSVSVAQKHYLQVTEAHITEAAKTQR
ncbi:MAG: tyrosine-type recombinase/integrase [Planctomycetota bacterium]